jgi:HD-GYP domain-containing protein (c-di-GMP phosphodiesterase class II)
LRRLSLDSLAPTPSLARPLYHESGALLFAAGERIAEEEIGFLRKNGIKKLYDLGEGDPGAGAPPGEDTQTIVAPIEPASLPDEVRRFRRDRRATTAVRALERAAARLPPERVIQDPRGELRNGGVERAIERSRAGESPEGTPGRDRLEGLRPDPPRGAREKQDAIAERRRTVERLAALFGAIRAGGGVPREEAGDIARDLFLATMRDPDVALALLADRPPEPAGEEHAALARHSVNVSVLVLASAIELGYGLEQLFEIAWAAVFHDVGMLRLPEALAAKTGELDADERRELERHPLHAMEVLRRFPEVPVALAAVAADEHERPDRSGYPRGAEPGELARIVAVADHFEALASPRPHRPARTPHEALRELVALAARKKLDAKPLRALMKALSLFPVGSYVRLQDGAFGRVVRAGGADLARPLVAVLEAEERVAAWVDLASRADLRIAETVAAPSGADPLVGF